MCLNFGGWGNKEHGLDYSGKEPVLRKPGSIESGRWYDVKVSLEGERVKVWLDGQPLFDQVIPSARMARAYLVAGLDRAAGEVVVKAVNPHAEPVAVALTLAGTQVAAQKARRILLAGLPDDVNTLEEPLRVSPKEDTVELAGAASQVSLPPHSLTVLRVKAE